NVSEFMEQQGLYLVCTKTGRQTDRYEDHGAEVADDDRHFGKTRFQECHGAADTRAMAQIAETILPLAGEGDDSSALHSPGGDPPSEAAQVKSRDARHPKRGKPVPDRAGGDRRRERGPQRIRSGSEARLRDVAHSSGGRLP